VKQVVNIVAFVVCMVIISGCGKAPAPSAAETTPTPRASVSARSASPTPSATQTTTRPWKVTLEKADSCRIIRAIPPKRFKSSQGKVDPTDSVHFPGNVGCSRLSGYRDTDPYWDDPGIMLNVIAVVDQAADDFVASPSIEELIDRRLTIDGFRAYVVKSPGPGQCNGLVDVADGQLLFVWLAQPYGSADKIVVPQAELCRTVPGVLSAALDVLRSTRSTS
jgi:Protein of unknown function (DUF3558)